MSSTNAFNVFDGFSEYQVKILFQGWMTITVWQFVASCIGLFVFTIIYHVLRWLRAKLEVVIRQTSEKLSDKYIAEETVRLVANQSSTSRSQTDRAGELVGLYMGMWVLSLVQHALFLLISMANMTFNPWVFLSIVMGYSVGDVAVHAKIAKLRST